VGIFEAPRLLVKELLLARVRRLGAARLLRVLTTALGVVRIVLAQAEQNHRIAAAKSRAEQIHLKFELHGPTGLQRTIIVVRFQQLPESFIITAWLIVDILEDVRSHDDVALTRFITFERHPNVDPAGQPLRIGHRDGNPIRLGTAVPIDGFATPIAATLQIVDLQSDAKP
jgi:hypothetical protein